MNKQYLCPTCNGHLKVGDYIILMVKNQEKKRGLLLLHPEVGNYTSLKHPNYKIEEKEVLEFCCPLCQSSLVSDFDERLAHLIQQDGEKTFDIYFSKIEGEKSTYKVNGDIVTASGEHSDKYTYFKMSDKFKQYLKK